MKIKKATIEKGHYYDKNGTEIHDGDTIRWDSGLVEKVYLTEHNTLGIDATNPYWIKTGRAAPCEYGIYPLYEYQLAEIEKVEEA